MKIVMLTTNPVDFDSRILKEAEVLSADFKITILARDGARNTHLKNAPFEIKRVKFDSSLSYQLAVLINMIRLIWATFSENPDIYHAHDLPGLICAWPAAVWKKKTLIYDSHELWASHYHFANTRGLHWLFPWLEKVLIKKVKKGITVNESLAQLLSQKYKKEFIAIHNYYGLQKTVRTKLDLKKRYPGEIVCLHIGSTGEGRGIEQLIQAARILPTGFVVALLGADKQIDQLDRLIKTNKVDRKVFLLPFVPSDEVIAVAKTADLGLVLTQNISQSYYLSSPNKLYQYVAAEIPILGSNFPEYKKVILGDKIGQVVDPAKPRLFASKIIELAKPENQIKYRTNLKNLAETKYNWSSEATRLTDLYHGL